MIIQGTTLSASRIGLGTRSLHRLSSSGARLTDEDPLTRTLEELKACGKVRYVGLSGQASSRLGTVLERLLAAAAQSVTLLSTNSAASLREAVAILGKFDKCAPRSATSSLA